MEGKAEGLVGLFTALAAIKELILEQIAEREECATSRVGRSVDTVGAGNTPGQGS